MRLQNLLILAMGEDVDAWWLMFQSQNVGGYPRWELKAAQLDLNK